MNEYYVYEYYIVPTGEVFYVGKGKNNRYKTLSKRNHFFQCIYRTHECAVRKIAEHLSEQEAFDKEREMIAYYRTHTSYRLTNQTDGGDGSSGYRMTEQQKQNIGMASKRKWQNPEYKARIIKARHDPNSTFQSKEFKAKISKLVTGIKNPNYAHSWTDQQRKHLSNVRKRLKLAVGNKNPTAQKVMCLETGQVFNTIDDAAKFYKMKCPSSISVALRDPVRTAHQLHWVKFQEDLLDAQRRYFYLLSVLNMASRMCAICCPEQLIVFRTRKDFLNVYHIGLKLFTRFYEQHGYFIIQNQKYMFVNDYLSRQSK